MATVLLNPFIAFTSGYRYYRLNISGTKGGINKCQLSEISWYIGASRQIPTSSSGPSDYTNVSDSQDNNTATKWFAGDSTSLPHILVFDFTTPIKLTSYSFTSGDDSSYADGAGARNPDDWTVEGSNDGSTWTTLDTETNANLAAVNLTVLGTWSLP